MLDDSELELFYSLDQHKTLLVESSVQKINDCSFIKALRYKPTNIKTLTTIPKVHFGKKHPIKELKNSVMCVAKGKWKLKIIVLRRLKTRSAAVSSLLLNSGFEFE